MIRCVFVVAVAIIVCLVPLAAPAQWVANGVAISTALRGQYYPAITSDGNDGAIIAWSDNRFDTVYHDIYAQKIDATGLIQWAADGVPICTAQYAQNDQSIISDGLGGAIVVWNDNRNGDFHSHSVYAQRIDATGTPMWANDGVLVASVVSTSVGAAVVSDGAGGVIVAFDNRVQRVSADGVVQWPTEGVPLFPSLYGFPTMIVSDGVGGAIITNANHVQRVDASGVPMWPGNGMTLNYIDSVYAKDYIQVIASDGAAGAIIMSAGFSAQRIDGSGATLWAPNGVTICGAVNRHESPAMISDGTGGAVVAWQDYRSNTNYDIYAQKVNGTGVVSWTHDGIPVCTASYGQLFPTLVTDGSGGAMVAWTDGRGGTYYDIYAQRVTASGTLQWANQGLPVSTAADTQYNQAIASDGAHGAIVAWGDVRDYDYETGHYDDIYAQRVGPGGVIPTAVTDKKTPSLTVLASNHPNPFSSSTSFELNVPYDGEVLVDVYDVTGRQVRHLQVGYMRAGFHEFKFDGADKGGHPLPSGAYFCRVRAHGATSSRKIIISR